MKAAFAFLSVIAIAIADVPLLAQTAAFTDSARRRKLEAALPEVDRIFAATAERLRAPGAAYGVIIDGELVHARGVGVQDLESKRPVDADTIFRIASMTKSFTAMAIVRLRDEGKLRLDDRADQYVPELAGLAYPTKDSPPITIRHLLSHAGGFPEDNPWGDQQLDATEAELTDWMRRGIPFSNPPGVAYEYSNYGFAILGRIVSRASGMRYADYVATHILQPLGMGATTFEPASVPPARVARGYRWEDERWKDEPSLADGSFGSMGGLLTSVRDLSRYVAFLLSAWPPRDDGDAGPIRRSSAREMQETTREAIASVFRDRTTLRLNAGGYGFGLRISQTCQFAHVVGHGGGLPGFGSLMRWLPEYGVGLVAMGNVTYAGWGRAFDDSLAALAATGALLPRQPAPSAALTKARGDVSALIADWDDARADAVAADNLFLDRSKDRRRAELAQLGPRHGTCRAGEWVEVENALRGRWKMPCQRGALSVAVTLAPTMPPRVQFLQIRSETTEEALASPTASRCPQ
jgi:CubicO group peptidase (beta-lactamase class C family)